MLVAAEDSDLEPIVALVNRAYRSSPGPGRSSWSLESDYISGDRTTEALLRADLQAAPQARLLKWADDNAESLLGCVWLQPLEDGVWYLGTLAVDPDRQNGGLGRTVLTAAETWIRDHGGVRVRMTVINVRDTLIAWYLRRGYEATGETNPFPYGDNRFGTPLRDDLCFIVLEKALTTA